jgi:hypothetical protein
MRPEGIPCDRRPRARAWLVAPLVGVVLFACATGAPAPPRAGTGTAWGYLRLVPREGVTPVKPGASPYADRRMRDVTFVDYSKPGFAVVQLAEGASPAGKAELAIRTTGVRTLIDPLHAAVGVGGAVVVRNESNAAHVLSAPTLGVVRRIEPGEELELALPEAGEQSFFLLDVPRSEASLFVASGPFAVVAADGRFELAGLAPGRHQLQAWHPRFPPARSFVDLAPDSIVRVDLEMGVDQRDASSETVPAAHP